VSGITSLVSTVTDYVSYRPRQRVRCYFRFAFGESPVQNVAELALDHDRLLASWSGEKVELTVTEFWLVACLARHPGQVKSRQQLMDAANLVLDVGYRWLDTDTAA